MSKKKLHENEITLLDLLDRILNKGVLIKGDLTISVADVELVYLGLRLLLASVDKAEELRDQQWEKMKQRGF